MYYRTLVLQYVTMFGNVWELFIMQHRGMKIVVGHGGNYFVFFWCGHNGVSISIAMSFAMARGSMDGGHPEFPWNWCCETSFSCARCPPLLVGIINHCYKHSPLYSCWSTLMVILSGSKKCLLWLCPASDWFRCLWTTVSWAYFWGSSKHPNIVFK